MNEALQKTFEILLIILIGYLLQRKLPQKEGLKGVKTLILSIALPATIFLSLLKIKLDTSLLFLPILALVFNLLMFGASLYLLPYFFPAKDGVTHRTRSLLIPSLAPGLSCFPFIVTYLGDDQLAMAALADVGNKVFGLILLFVVAMYWYRIRSIQKKNVSQIDKLKNLLASLGSEPINIVILIALVLLAFGIGINELPVFAQSVIGKLSTIMVPLVLLFIGLSVRIGWSDFLKMVQLLTWRSGVAFLLSGLALLFLPAIAAPMALLLLVFPQSSCSFWPFAHMCTITSMEEGDQQPKPTFSLDYAVNMLACSLPFSTCVIIGIFYIGESIINPALILTVGISMITIATLPNIKKVMARTSINDGALRHEIKRPRTIQAKSR